MANHHKRTGAITVTAVALLLVATPAPAAIRLGTDAAETITGTQANDHITGEGGNDVLKGLAGDDTYAFDDGWGLDTLQEKATYKVAGKKVPGGKDTLSFAHVTGGGVVAQLTPEWAAINPGYNATHSSTDWSGSAVLLGNSVVENATGSRSVGQTGGDSLWGGAGPSTLHSGGGGGSDATSLGDYLGDFGGYEVVVGGSPPPLPASNDTYQGVAANTGIVQVADYGGAADTLDLRPFAVADAYLKAVDADQDDARTKETLQIVLDADTSVYAIGHFGPFSTWSNTSYQGRIEKLRFANGTLDGSDSAALAASAAKASTRASADRADLGAVGERTLAALHKGLGKNPPPPVDPAHPGAVTGTDPTRTAPIERDAPARRAAPAPPSPPGNRDTTHADDRDRPRTHEPEPDRSGKHHGKASRR